MTKAELRLRRRLKKENVPFQAQVKVHTSNGRNYLVDLLIDNHIIVEVGYVGITDVQENEDLRKDGYTVLRFRNNEVRRSLSGVVETIKNARRCR